MRYPDSVRVEAFDLLVQGVSARHAAGLVGISRPLLQKWIKVAGMQMRKGRRGGLVHSVPVEVDLAGEWVDEHGRLTQAGRALIQIRTGDGWSAARIAAELGVHRATVGREVARNTYDGRYQAARAQR